MISLNSLKHRYFKPIKNTSRSHDLNTSVGDMIFFKFIESQPIQKYLKTSTEDMISLNSLKDSYFKKI